MELLLLAGVAVVVTGLYFWVIAATRKNRDW